MVIMGAGSCCIMAPILNSDIFAEKWQLILTLQAGTLLHHAPGPDNKPQPSARITLKISKAIAFRFGIKLFRATLPRRHAYSLSISTYSAGRQIVIRQGGFLIRAESGVYPPGITVLTRAIFSRIDKWSNLKKRQAGTRTGSGSALCVLLRAMASSSPRQGFSVLRAERVLRRVPAGREFTLPQAWRWFDPPGR